MADSSNESHVYPAHEEHKASMDCWCDPYLYWVDPENDGEVWIHRRGDN